MSRYLASNGIASLRFDYSGAGESEGSFAAMTVSTMVADLISAVHFVQQTYAPAHCLLLGHSLGAAVAAMVAPAIDTRGLILLAPLATPLEQVKSYQTVLQNGPNQLGYFELGPHEMALEFIDDLHNAKPLESIAERYQGDLLIFHGDHDQRIATTEAQAYVDSASKRGLNATYHELKNADHRFSSVASRQVICEVMTTWIKERFL
jgi:pimeloyl-ACP methyl ester carboxylesterase